MSGQRTFCQLGSTRNYYLQFSPQGISSLGARKICTPYLITYAALCKEGSGQYEMKLRTVFIFLSNYSAGLNM